MTTITTTTTMDEIMALYEKAQSQAMESGLDEQEDCDDLLGLEAEIFEGLLGNWLLENPLYIPFFKGDEGWRQDLEDLLHIEWEEFMSNVEASVA
jgi:hypothetical protein